jgi:hypothetical protein
MPALAGQIGPPQPPVDIEVGARYWYSWGHDKLNLLDTTGAFQVSRLTWQNMKGSSLEGFFRANTKMGVFVKGYLGGGWLNNGSLQDEDFPPFISPYSSTDSSAKGNLKYGSIDLGYNFVNSAATKIGPFVGYHYWQDSKSRVRMHTNGRESVHLRSRDRWERRRHRRDLHVEGTPSGCGG